MRKSAALLLIALLHPVSAIAVDCSDLKPTSPQNTDSSYTGKLDGAIDGFFGKLAAPKVSAEGNYKQVATSVLQQFSNGDTTYMWERVLFLQCQLLGEAKDISSTEKLNMLSELYGKFTKPPPPLNTAAATPTNSIVNSGNGVTAVQGNGNSVGSGR